MRISMGSATKSDQIDPHSAIGGSVSYLPSFQTYTMYCTVLYCTALYFTDLKAGKLLLCVIISISMITASACFLISVSA